MSSIKVNLKQFTGPACGFSVYIISIMAVIGPMGVVSLTLTLSHSLTDSLTHSHTHSFSVSLTHVGTQYLPNVMSTNASFLNCWSPRQEEAISIC